ncbi:hypothetical protein K2X33_05080 [bacterium]|nr:hypothetical protein [bacterium]
MAKGTLWILGMPLHSEWTSLPPLTVDRLAGCDVYIGESRKIALRFLSRVPDAKTKPLFLMDEASRPEERQWRAALREASSKGGTVALFSDTGMPLLYDPGREVLWAAQELGMSIRCESGPTSWGTSTALTGWDPPFLVVGFPPREKPDRERFWNSLRQSRWHCVLMERPYRFLSFLDECAAVFGATREAFLAWELDAPTQRLLWGSLEKLARTARGFEKTKGEFVLVLKGSAPSTPRENFS